MAWNPFSAVAGAFGAARDAVAGAFGAARDIVTPGREEPSLPKFVDDVARDDRLLGADSEVNRSMDQAAADFIADRGGLGGLDADARAWLEQPTMSEIFGDYWKSGGFTADQVLAGMQNISNVTIKENADGSLDIDFDYESDVDGYEVTGHYHSS